MPYSTNLRIARVELVGESTKNPADYGALHELMAKNFWSQVIIADDGTKALLPSATYCCTSTALSWQLAEGIVNAIQSAGIWKTPKVLVTAPEAAWAVRG